jgi:hypothetical protein
MSVTKKSSIDQDKAPDYKLIFTADDNTSVNQGFYYFESNPENSEEKNGKNEGYLISRVLSAAKAVVPKDFKFPEVSNSKEALDALFTIMKEHAPNNKVNVFVTYGTKERPGQYLGLRYFDFVESADTLENTSRLKVKNMDMMERVVPDAPVADAPTTGPKSW